MATAAKKAEQAKLDKALVKECEKDWHKWDMLAILDLVKAGADVNNKESYGSGLSPLYYAAVNFSTQYHAKFSPCFLPKFMLEHGGDPTICMGFLGHSPIFKIKDNIGKGQLMLNLFAPKMPLAIALRKVFEEHDEDGNKKSAAKSATKKPTSIGKPKVGVKSADKRQRK